MKLYVLTKSSKITPLNKQIVGIFNYVDGENKKLILNSLNNDFIYNLEGPFNVSDEKPLVCDDVDDLVFPKVPNTPLVLPKNKIMTKNLI